MSKVPYKRHHSSDEDDGYEVVSIEEFCDRSSGSQTQLLTPKKSDKPAKYADKERKASSGGPEKQTETSLMDPKTIKKKLIGSFAPKSSGSQTHLLTSNDNINYCLSYESDKEARFANNEGKASSGVPETQTEQFLKDPTNFTINKNFTEPHKSSGLQINLLTSNDNINYCLTYESEKVSRYVGNQGTASSRDPESQMETSKKISATFHLTRLPKTERKLKQSKDLDEFSVYMGYIDELPRGVQLESPLIPKRRHKRTPSSRTSYASIETPTLLLSVDPNVLEIVKVEAEPSNQPAGPVETSKTTSLAALSPAVITKLPSPSFIDCGSSGHNTQQSCLSSTRRGQDMLPPLDGSRCEEITLIDNSGSDDESDDEDDDVDAEANVLLRGHYYDMSDAEEVADDDASVTVSDVAPAEASSANAYGPTSMFDFQWRAFPNCPIPPKSRREAFCSANCGPTAHYAEPYDAFIAIWDRQTMLHIAEQTNIYAEQLASLMLNDSKMCASSRIADWKDTTADELYVYLSIVLATGIVIKTRLEEYWSSSSDIFFTPGFCIHMSLRRFQLLSKCLHFNNNAHMANTNLSRSAAKLFKIQPILDRLNEKFSSLYNLSCNIALDDSLTQWKAWLNINQFISNKVAAIGIKTYEICESQTGYLWRFGVHQGREAASSPLDPVSGTAPAIVLRLLKGLEYKGHTLWMNNSYNSPALARKLKSLGFDCVGTLRTNQQYVPLELASLKKSQMRLGQVYGCTSGDVDIMVWRAKNCVSMISTYHGNAVSEVDNGTKPILIRDYNVCMAEVDKKDQTIATFPIEKKRTKVWYKKLFRRLLNVSVLNAFVLYKHSNPQSNHRQFRKDLIQSMLSKHSTSSRVPQSVGKGAGPILDVREHHALEYDFLPSSKHSARIRRKCVVCKKRTSTYCAGCKVPVCVFSCFVARHTEYES